MIGQKVGHFSRQVWVYIIYTVRKCTSKVQQKQINRLKFKDWKNFLLKVWYTVASLQWTRISWIPTYLKQSSSLNWNLTSKCLQFKACLLLNLDLLRLINNRLWLHIIRTSKWLFTNKMFGNDHHPHHGDLTLLFKPDIRVYNKMTFQFYKQCKGMRC